MTSAHQLSVRIQASTVGSYAADDMEQEDHADGQITEISEQIFEFPPQAETESEERVIVEKLGEMESEERVIVEELGAKEQEEKVLDAREANLNQKIKEMERKRQDAEGTSEVLTPAYIALLLQGCQIGQARKTLNEERKVLNQNRDVLIKEREVLNQERIALLKPDRIEKSTISSWLKQVVTRIRPIQLGIVHRKRGGRRGGLYRKYAPIRIRMWTSFKEDVLTTNDSIKDDTKRYGRLTLNDMEDHSDAGNEAVIAIFLHRILYATSVVRGDCILAAQPSIRSSSNSKARDLSISKSTRNSPDTQRVPLTAGSAHAMNIANAKSDGYPDFALETPGREVFLPVEVKKLDWFRKSEAKPLPDLVNAYKGFVRDKSEANKYNANLATSIRQCVSYMVKFKVGYSVLMSVDASYFLRWETNGAKESIPHLEIFEGIALEAEEPTLLQCLYFIIDIAIREKDSFKEFVPQVKDESSNEQEGESAGSPLSPDDADGDWAPPDESRADDDTVSRPQTMSETRKKSKFNEETQLQLHETQASDLHLDKLPFTSGGWSGNVVLGRVKGCRAVVKLAMKKSSRGKALLKEARAYTKLMDYWGKCVPKLVDYGTTAHGQLIFIATEFVIHNPRGIHL
ncbi:unnamed protein product [Calypogeia fissa]